MTQFVLFFYLDDKIWAENFSHWVSSANLLNYDGIRKCNTCVTNVELNKNIKYLRLDNFVVNNSVWGPCKESFNPLSAMATQYS